MISATPFAMSKYSSPYICKNLLKIYIDFMIYFGFIFSIDNYEIFFDGFDLHIHLIEGFFRAQKFYQILLKLFIVFTMFLVLYLWFVRNYQIIVGFLPIYFIFFIRAMINILNIIRTWHFCRRKLNRTFLNKSELQDLICIGSIMRVFIKHPPNQSVQIIWIHFINAGHLFSRDHSR